MLEEITRKIVSYCDIPEEITEDSYMSEMSPDCYINHKIATDEDRSKYDDSWELDDWLLNEYDELSKGDEILIEIDY